MADPARRIAVFGATGSIGSSTLDLVGRFPDRFRANVLTAGSDARALAELALRFRPDHVGIADETQVAFLRDALEGTEVEVHGGDQAVAELAKVETDLTVAAITGMAGLLPTMNAVRRGGMVAIANKESIVAAGSLIMAEARRSGAVILPIDSEHNAIQQAWMERGRDTIDSIILTASGGPFRDASMEDMRVATPAAALKHPNWSMGAKVSIDSATMMNKGLEVIEAGVLFDLPEDRVRVAVHRQSVVHGMVCYRDGSILAQLGDADMRVPISYALAWPERLDWGAKQLGLDDLAELSFDAPDDDRFPCLPLARAAMRRGGLAPAGLNTANEVAVNAFLQGSIGFLDIAALNRHILEEHEHPAMVGLDDVLDHDQHIREICRNWLAQHGA